MFTPFTRSNILKTIGLSNVLANLFDRVKPPLVEIVGYGFFLYLTRKYFDPPLHFPDSQTRKDILLKA